MDSMFEPIEIDSYMNLPEPPEGFEYVYENKFQPSDRQTWKDETFDKDGKVHSVRHWWLRPVVPKGANIPADATTNYHYLIIKPERNLFDDGKEFFSVYEIADWNTPQGNFWQFYGQRGRFMTAEQVAVIRAEFEDILPVVQT